jgi:hypothetical protein
MDLFGQHCRQKGDLKELYIADKTLPKEGKKDSGDVY